MECPVERAERVVLRDTPGPAGLISPGPDVDPHVFLGELIREYGETVRYNTRFRPCYLFLNPADVETILHRDNFRRAALTKMMLGEGLLSSDGPLWKSQRRLMQGDFVRAQVARFAPLFTRRTSYTESDWLAASRSGAIIDIPVAMTDLTLRIIVEALFGDDLDGAQAARLREAVTQALDVLGTISWTIFGIPVNFTPKSTQQLTEANAVFNSTCSEMITRRRSMKPGDRPKDLLTLLIEDEDENDPGCNQRLRDQFVTMLVAGHETTALALSWAWKLLAENPRTEERLHNEIDTVLRGRTPELNDVPKLPYAAAVIQESMRLYPPVWNIVRVANETDVVGGHEIPRGACVSVSPWFTHRHPKFWANPEAFDPTRFVGQQPRHRYAFFPFGGGRHQCLGMHLANLEGTLVLAQLAQRFRIRPIAGQMVKPSLGMTLRQTPHLHANVESRTSGTIPPARPLEAA